MTLDVDTDGWATGLQGQILDGRYEIERLLGSGGMGAVFEGRQVKLRKAVAIKLLRPEYAGRQVYRERFLREARAASRIGHRNVVDISDFGETPDGRVFFVMELLHGEDLAQRLRRVGAMPWREARALLMQIIRGLEAAHRNDVIHRDVKPANVFLVDTPDDEPDDLKLLDFGVAKVTDPTSSDAAGLTSADKIMGTAMFMAPEQALGKPVDARSDVYAVGCIAFQMLAGRPAYPGVNAIEILMRRLNEPPPSLRDELAHIPTAIEGFVRQAMARDPVARFQTMAEMKEALRGLPRDIDGEVVPTRPNEVGESTATSSRGRAWSGPATQAPSSIPTEAVAVDRSEPEGYTSPNPQPSTAERRQLTHPMSRPSEPASIPVVGFAASSEVGETHEPPRRGRAAWVLAPLVVVGLGAAGWWAAHRDPAPTEVADAKTPPPATDDPAGPSAPAEPAVAPPPPPPAAAVGDPGPQPQPATGETGVTQPAGHDGADVAPTPPPPVDKPAKLVKRRPPKSPPSAPAPPAPRDVEAEAKAVRTAILRKCTLPPDANVSAKFNVDASGRVPLARVTGTDDAALTECIRKVVLGSRFSAGDGLVPVTLSLRS